MPQRLPIVSDFPRTSAVFSLKVGAVTHRCTNLGRQGLYTGWRWFGVPVACGPVLDPISELRCFGGREPIVVLSNT